MDGVAWGGMALHADQFFLPHLDWTSPGRGARKTGHQNFGGEGMIHLLRTSSLTHPENLLARVVWKCMSNVQALHDFQPTGARGVLASHQWAG